MKQILANLATNARDAMAAGGLITVGTSNVDLSGDAFVALSFSDTGSGMSSETAEHLFEPFFTTKDPGSGTGLGLSIVHSLVSDLSGRIHVESAPGSGATFTIYLPEAGTVPEFHDFEDRISSARRAATILLVEDQDDVRSPLSMHLLGSSGYKVH